MTSVRIHARRLASIGAAAAVAASSLLLAQPATAAISNVALSGVQSGGLSAVQNLTISLNTSDMACGSVQAPGVQVLGTLNNGSQQVLGSAVLASCADGVYSYTYAWIPSATGTWGVQASGDGVLSNTQSATIGGVATITTISAPNVATVGAPTTVTVTVQSTGGSTYRPTGSVIVKDQTGATVANMGLTPQGAGQSYAYWRWTPPTTGTYTFQATYGGDSSATGSTSAVDQVLASPSGNTITLTAPGTVTVGVPVTLTATLVPSTIQGSVGFTLNGAPISASVPIKNGTASFTWTPTTPGAANLGASYTTNGGGSGSSSPSAVNIVAGAVTNDVITLTQSGVGTWSPNGTYSATAGSTIAFTASTLSGSGVTLTESGPCAVNGLTVIAGPNGSTCNLVARSNGGNGYAPVSYGYTIRVGIGQQTANVNPPISGRVNKGKAIVLEGPGQGDTNAGQNVVWRVAKGSKSVCKLGFPADGSVTVTLRKRGQCTVVGAAPGIPGQWSPYRISRTYRA